MVDTPLGVALTVAVFGLAVGLPLGLLIRAGTRALIHESRLRRRDSAITSLLTTFAPAIDRARTDPGQLLVWHPLASAARTLLPDAFDELDRAVGGVFPFGAAEVQTAHAQCTAEWLAWERSHDFDYKLRASAAEQELEQDGQLHTSIGKARLAAIEREYLEQCQARYTEYVRVAKALAALETASSGGSPPTNGSAGRSIQRALEPGEGRRAVPAGRRLGIVEVRVPVGEWIGPFSGRRRHVLG